MAKSERQDTWQILDVNSVWMKEFACALGELAPVTCWSPIMRRLGMFEDWQSLRSLGEPPLEVVQFPLQRGYARSAVQRFYRYESGLLKRMMDGCFSPKSAPLICSTPFYAPVAERWPGPTVYYVTDLTAGYDGIDAEQVIALDKRMCRAARAVCPNSVRIAEYLVSRAACDPQKITIVPNATRAGNIAEAPLLGAGARPLDLKHLRGPIAGVIGNLAANMDWILLAEAIQQTPGVSWVFVGPACSPIADRTQAKARSWVMQHATFTGPKPYGELQSYARCFEVAILPYLKREPTYSGSSTRFYEHLAACRPMLATRGFAELLAKPPLLELVDHASEIAACIARLRLTQFHDGYEALRWEASKRGTWQVRARTLMQTILEPDKSSSLAENHLSMAYMSC